VLICYAPYTFVKLKMHQNLFSAYALTPNPMQIVENLPSFLKLERTEKHSVVTVVPLNMAMIKHFG